MACHPTAGGDPEAVRAAVAARVGILEGLEEVVGLFSRLGDVDGIHYSAKLIWNAGG